MSNQSRITNCLFRMRDGEEPLFSGDGTVCVRLDGYAVIPKEEYARLVLLAEIAAERIAVNAINKAMGGQTS